MYILQESTHFTHFVAIYAYFYVTLGGSAQIITILHRGGVCPIYYNITWGGVRPIYYNITWGGGFAETPKLYYVIYEQPLRVDKFNHHLFNICTQPAIRILNIQQQ